MNSKIILLKEYKNYISHTWYRKIICATPNNWLQVIEYTPKIGMNKLINIWLHQKRKNTATNEEILAPNR